MRQVKDGPHHQALLELFTLLGKQWTLRVLWELRNGPLSYRALAEACGGMSSSVLTHRLRDLRSAGFVFSTDNGYRMTPIAEAGLEVMGEMNQWAETWAATRPHTPPPLEHG